MKLQPFDALKFFAILFPVMIGVRWAASLTIEPIDNWRSVFLLSALTSLVFSLLYTAYRKPKS